MRRSNFSSCICLLLLLAVTSQVAGRDPQIARPESVGLSPNRLQRISDNLHTLIEQDRLAGAVTLVARRGKVAHIEAHGWQDREQKVEMKPDAIFRIASMTKPITSAAVMMLYEEGHFKLEDPVAKFIPELKDLRVLVTTENGKQQTVPAARPVTIHHLLTHTSGLTYQWDEKVGRQYHDLGITHGLIQDPDTIGDSVKLLSQVPLIHQPGERFTYGLNTDVLGYLVEVVSGQTLDAFLRARMFQPLGMEDTAFFIEESQVPRLATVYRVNSDGRIVRQSDEDILEGEHFRYTTTYPFTGPRRYYSGGGGLCSTATDYLKFCQMLLNNGRAGDQRLLSRKSIELMTAPHVALSTDTNLDQGSMGLGVGITGRLGNVHELGSPAAYGWGGFFYTRFFIDPQEELVAITMAQLHPAGDVDWNERFSILVYQAIDD